MSGWSHYNAKWKEKQCILCATTFLPNSGAHKFCSSSCKGKYKYISGKENTNSQYKKISGNWERYISRLLVLESRKNLSRGDIIALLEQQNYLCALSGESLTCNLEKGKLIMTNMSIDRIVPGYSGGQYTLDNIRLVQKRFNIMKWEMTDDEFLASCRKVLEFNEQKEKTT